MHLAREASLKFWELFRDLNPMRKVKFFKELYTGMRTLSPKEEERLLRNAAPYLQDLIRFDLNTGLRSGELFILHWSNVDFEKSILNVFAPKTQKTRCVPINSAARKVLEAWALGRRNEFVFYNFDTGNRLLISERVCTRMSEGGDRRCDVAAHAATHICFSFGESWSGYSDSPTIARAFGYHRNDALYALKSRLEAGRSRKTRRV